jgi:hypothetical protein
MNKLLRGNFEVKKNLEISTNDHETNTADEFRKRALESIGGSMVFVERDLLLWDDVDHIGDQNSST